MGLAHETIVFNIIQALHPTALLRVPGIVARYVPVFKVFRFSIHIDLLSRILSYYYALFSSTFLTRILTSHTYRQQVRPSM